MLHPFDEVIARETVHDVRQGVPVSVGPASGVEVRLWQIGRVLGVVRSVRIDDDHAWPRERQEGARLCAKRIATRINQCAGACREDRIDQGKYLSVGDGALDEEMIGATAAASCP